ncbi:hypothetical protein HYW35_03190 [Candidatus Saccharibacteria bacterium]|nr:hypothetical protein [Candidatus Saccharibacteria bacterium]
MPQPMFREQGFVFEEGQEAPVHVDDYPKPGQMNPSLYHVEGVLADDGDAVWLAINLPDRATADLLVAAANRRDESLKETARSRGEYPYGLLGYIGIIEPPRAAS